MNDGPTRETEKGEGAVSRLIRWVTPKALRQRYSRKFLVVFLLVIAGITAVGGVNVYLVQEAITDETTQEFRTQAESRATLQGEWVAGMETQTQLVSGNVQPVSLSLSTARRQSSPDVVAIHYVNVTRGVVVASTDQDVSGMRLEMIDSPWMRTLERVSLPRALESTVWVANQSHERDGQQVISFVSPADAPGAAVVVVGNNGRLTEQFAASSTLQTTVHGSTGQQLFGNGTVGALNETAFSRSRQTGESFIDEDGRQLRVYAAVPGTEWVAVTSAPRSKLFQTSRAVTRNVVSISIVGVVLLVVVGVGLGRHTIRPLRRLQRQTNQLSTGNFDVDLTTTRIDEIGDLYLAFSHMRDALQQQIEETVDAKEEVESQRDNLQDLNTRLELALEATNTGVWEWNVETDELFWDAASETLFGFDPGEFDSDYSAFLDCVHPDEVSAVRSQLEEAIETGDRYQADFRIQIPGGGLRWIQSRGIVEDDGSIPARMLGVHTDITERKQFEQRLEEKNQNLEVLNRIVRHDIRNDMHIILGYFPQLADSIEDPDDRERLDLIMTHAEHIVETTDIVRDLMEVMLEEDQERKPVSLARYLQAEIDQVATVFDDAVVRVDGPLPDAMVIGNELLSSVFKNVLRNAIQHNDSETPTVFVSVSERDDSVVVRIADNGPGIPRGQRDVMLQRGETGLESTGTGIGLYLVNTLIEKYGGDLWIEDNDPRGTAIYLELVTVD